MLKKNYRTTNRIFVVTKARNTKPPITINHQGYWIRLLVYLERGSLPDRCSFLWNQTTTLSSIPTLINWWSYRLSSVLLTSTVSWTIRWNRIMELLCPITDSNRLLSDPIRSLNTFPRSILWTKGMSLIQTNSRWMCGRVY
jgi:hypothetical protein